MSSEEEDYSETTMWILLGTMVTTAIAGLSWLCKKKCRNQECEISSGCCRFHSDSRLRETIRQEIHRERVTRDSESQITVPTD